MVVLDGISDVIDIASQTAEETHTHSELYEKKRAAMELPERKEDQLFKHLLLLQVSQVSLC